MISDLLIAFGIALLLTFLFTSVLGTTGPWRGFWPFFLVVMLFAWAASVWVPPVGPALIGAYWLAPLIFALAIAFVIAAASPPSRRRVPTERDAAAPAPAPETETAVAAVGLFMWIAVLVLVSSVLIGYLW
jgi:hypothetical protein